MTLNCGYGRGFSVLEVVDTVKRVSGVDFKVEFTAAGPATRPRSSPPATASALRSNGGRVLTIWKPSPVMRLAWERKLSKRTG
jgi:UDP-glucose 4-epimerase